MPRKSFNRTRNRRQYNRVPQKIEAPDSHEQESEENAGVAAKLKKLFKGIKEAVSIKDDFTVADDSIPAVENLPVETMAKTDGGEIGSGVEIKIEQIMKNETEETPDLKPEAGDDASLQPPVLDTKTAETKKMGNFFGSLFKRKAQPASDDVIAYGEEKSTEDGVLTESFTQNPGPDEGVPSGDDRQEPPVSEPEPEKATPMSKEEVLPKEGVLGDAPTGSGWVKRLFNRKEKPIDEILEIKKLEKKFLDDQIKNRRKEEARLLKKTRRSKRERKSTLDSLAKARRDLNETMVAMKAGVANVKTLEKQTAFLQQETVKETLRQENLREDNHSSQNKLEQLRNEISETEENLHQISSAYKLRQQENDALNDLMGKTQQRLDGLTTAVEEQDNRRTENESLLQEISTQIAIAEQAKQDKLKEGVMASEEVAKVQKTLEEKQHQVSVMESVAAEIQRDMADKQFLLSSYKEEIETLERNVERDRAQSEQVNSELKELESLRVQVNQQVYQTKVELEKIEENKKTSESQLDRISIELTNANSLLVERTRQVSALDSGIAELKESIEKKQETIIQLQQKLEALRQNGLSMAQKIEELQKQKADALGILESTTAQIAASENVLNSRQAVIKELDVQQESLRNDNDKLSKQIRNKEQEQLHLSESISMIMSSQEEMDKKLNETRGEYQRVSDELNKINADTDFKKRHYDNLLEEETVLERTVEHRKIELADWSRKVADIQDKFYHLEGEVAANAETREKLLREIYQNREELSDLTGQKEDTEKTLKALRQKRDGLGKWIKDALDFKDHQAVFIKDELAKSKVLESQVNELTRKLVQSRKELEETDNENHRLLQERGRGIQTAESSLAELNRQLGEVKDTISQGRAEIEKMLKQEDELKSKISELQDSREKHETETAEKRLLKEKAEAGLKTAQEEFEKQSQQQNSRLAIIFQETESSQQKLDSINEQLKIARAEVSNRESQRKELDTNLADLKTKLQEINTQIEMELASVNTRKVNLQQEIEKTNSEFGPAKAKLVELQESITLKANDEAALLKRFQMLSQEVTEMETMKKESRELYRKIEDQKRILEDLELQIDKKSGLFS